MRALLLAGTALAAASPAFADTAAVDTAIDTITIVGLQGDARRVPGSAALLTTEDLRAQDYSDISRVLRRIPGVNIQEEDGYGLRPNIGLRGTGLDRSSSITLMEDGILAAPAPYAAPAAYYSPLMGRMAGIEVVKGASGVRYGPRTQGGSINMFSTPLPEEFGARIAATVGEESARRLHAYAGGMREISSGVRFGALAEVYSDEADGFKTIDFHPNRTTGFDIIDYGGKLRLEVDGGGVTHSFELRGQRSDETSDETYMGLTDADFALNPFRRYTASQNDQINVDQERYTFTYNADFDNGLRLTALAYRTEVARNWFKVEGVNTGAGRRSLTAILENPDQFADEFAALTGGAGFASVDDAIISRNNNRAYYAEGLQGEIAGSAEFGGASHRWRAGVRYHRDQEDRFQWEVFSRNDNGTLVTTSEQLPGEQANRISQVDALSIFVQDDITIGRLTLTPGLRYERIEGERIDFAAGDLARTGQGARIRENTIDVFIPGLSILYDVNDRLSLFGGVHRGFAPSAPGSPSGEEKAVNWEAGLRWSGDLWFADVAAFYNDYSNLTGTCTASTGGECQIGDQFDGGEVDVFGLELTAGTDLAVLAGLTGVSIPVQASYTWTDAQFQTSFQSSFNPWGNVTEGDRLPYIPEHQIYVSAGLEIGRFGSQVALNWVDERRTRAGQGPIPADVLLESYAAADVSAWYDLTDFLRARIQVRNVTDKVYAASRSPSGLRPGAPRAVLFGISAEF